MSKLKGSILIIDDDPDVLHTARIVLKQHFTDVKTDSNPQQINYLVSNEHFDVILLDMNYTVGATSGKEGLFWLKRIREIKPNQQVIMITAYGDIKLAVEAMKIGAADFVVKPWENEKLHATVLAAFNHSQSKKEIERLKTHNAKLNEVYASPENEIIGESATIQEVFKVIRKVAGTDANVLILGENGTGKELVAKAIHNHSERKGKAFVKVDLGSISETLFESELFGHKRGAFTDAKEDRPGRFEIASGGTLFLDEIGNLSLPLQAKLLTALQSRQVTRIGTNEPLEIDVRLICATNMPLYDMAERKEFREDLLYRFNTVEIELPPLRSRKEDIPLLIDHFLEMYGKKYRKTDIAINKEAVGHLQNHRWPGNIRELQHAVERAVIMADDHILRKSDFLLSHGKAPATSKDKNYNLDNMEKDAIIEVIRKNGGNMSKAAKELGVGRTTLYRKIEKYGI
ncbi:MAG: sigma-54 dependent transcriptional regulator [Bacteroidota bacterium]